jgi:beta-glucosidase
MSNRSFPADFRFGASTAAYQIEGAWNVDGKGESIWDHYTHSPGRIAGGDTGDVACDHYSKFEADLDLAAAAGLTVYRFSIAWTRIIPDGDGAVNAAGVAFYRRLAGACHARGITPWACLYHWDYPQALQDRGGWTARDSIDWFVRYAQVCARELGDVIKHWAMFNEPSIFTAMGFALGIHAPGVADFAAYGAAVHHVNLATAGSLRAMRSILPDALVGTVLSLNHMVPYRTSNADDLAAAEFADAMMNRSFADPLFLGTYPAALDRLIGPHVQPGDMESLKTPVDWLGINHYSRMHIDSRRTDTPGSADGAAAGGGLGWRMPPDGAPVTAMGWEIYPQGLYDIVARVHADYGPVPIYITENGGAFPDLIGADGRVDDEDRIALLHGYLNALSRAVADGMPVQGYFVWSLLDNFEWTHGYSKRFGIIHVDYATQARTPKASYYWYAALAKTGVLAD